MSAVSVDILNCLLPVGADGGPAPSRRSGAAGAPGQADGSFERVWKRRQERDRAADASDVPCDSIPPERARPRADAARPAPEDAVTEAGRAADTPPDDVSPAESPQDGAVNAGDAAQDASNTSQSTATEDIMNESIQVQAQGGFNVGLATEADAGEAAVPEAPLTGRCVSAGAGAPATVTAPEAGSDNTARAEAEPLAGTATEAAGWPIRSARDLLTLFVDTAGAPAEGTTDAKPSVDQTGGAEAESPSAAALRRADSQVVPAEPLAGSGSQTAPAAMAAALVDDEASVAEPLPADDGSASGQASATQAATLASAVGAAVETPDVPVGAAATTTATGQVDGRAGSASADVADQLAEGIRASGGQTDREIVIRLYPPELGRVRITLRSDDGAIRGVVRVDTPETLGKLQHEAVPLLGRLQADGIDLRRLDVLLNEGETGGQAGHDAAFRHGQADPDTGWAGARGQGLSDTGVGASAAGGGDESPEAMAGVGSVNVRV